MYTNKSSVGHHILVDNLSMCCSQLTTGCYFKTNRWHAVIGCQKGIEYTVDHYCLTIRIIPVKCAMYASGQCEPAASNAYKSFGLFRERKPGLRQYVDQHLRHLCQREEYEKNDTYQCICIPQSFGNFTTTQYTKPGLENRAFERKQHTAFAYVSCIIFSAKFTK